MKAKDDLQKENDEKSKKISDLEDVEMTLRQEIIVKESQNAALEQDKSELRKQLDTIRDDLK